MTDLADKLEALAHAHFGNRPMVAAGASDPIGFAQETLLSAAQALRDQEEALRPFSRAYLSYAWAKKTPFPDDHVVAKTHPKILVGHLRRARELVGK